MAEIDVDGDIETEIVRPRTRWYVNAADFANMVKAFIGSNYLSIAFAFHQSGLGLGLIGISIIASLTDHCCHVLARTKHYTIDKLVDKARKKKQEQSRRNSYNSNGVRDSGVEEEEEEEEINDETNPALANYAGSIDEPTYDVVDHDELREHMFKHMTYGDLGKLSYGSKGVGIVNFCIALTQFGFCVGYFIFIGNTIQSLFPTETCVYNNTHLLECHTNTLTEEEEDGNQHPLEPGFGALGFQDIYAPLEPNISTIVPNITTTTAPQFTEKVVSNAPDLRILVASPLPIFIFFAFIRGVRYLGIISVMANSAILIGCVSILVFLFIDFEVHGTIVWWNFEGFPVFFGMVTAAFEGIGLVIPIESSMEGNRHLFPAFLHGAIFVLTAVLGSFGILGYLKFGTNVHQMLNTNIPSNLPTAMAVNIGICLGILLTFPLQIFPVIQILELYLFSEGKIFGPRKTVVPDEEESLMTSDRNALLPDDVGVASHVPTSIASWKRNLLRITIVLLAGGLAVALRNMFAYVGAFVGAVGSSVLAYILPCLFHLKLCGDDLHPFVKVKDIVIVIFGIIASLISLGSVIMRIATNTLE